MKDYKGWTGKERQRSLYLTKKARKLGIMKPKDACERCGQSEGIIHWHNENYGVTLDVLGKAFKEEKRNYLTEDEISKCESVLETLCWRCHMMHHTKHREDAKKKIEDYFSEVKGGKIFPPVFRHNFSILRREHGV